jgi:hypothetical protein
MNPTRACVAGCVVLAVAASGASGVLGAGMPPAGSMQAQAQTQVPAPTPQDPAGAFELLFDQAKRQFDALQYSQAVPSFDRLILALTQPTATSTEPQRPDLLVQAYELRARARFALGDSPGAEQDFSALLALKPDFSLASGVSPRVTAVFENVRRLTVGRLMLQMTPPGDVLIGGRRYTVGETPLTLDMKSGEHLVNATRPNFTPFERLVTINASEVVSLTIALERVSSTISVLTTPEDVEVLLNEVSKGRTALDASGGTASLTMPDIALGSHRLRLRRECFVDVEMALTVGPEDGQTVPVQLTPAVAKVTFTGVDADATLVIDGQPHGPVIGEVTVCSGPHVLEVRSPRGRFVDRRDWKAGEAVTIAAEMRSAVPVVMSNAGTGTTTADQIRTSIERALAPSKRVLVYAPVAAELDAALKAENVPADWLAPDAAGTPKPRDVTRDIGRRLAARLGVQGVAVATVAPDGYSVSLQLLAAGSGEPDVLTLSLADSASQTRAIERLNAPLPPLVLASLESSFIDVAGVAGAVVVRTSATSGLAVGDVITSAAGTPVTSVGTLRSVLASQTGTDATLALEVRGQGAATRQVASPVTMVVDTLPVRDPALLANRALFELQGAVRAAAPGAPKAAASIGLALVHMRLANWEDALAALKDVQLAEGSGVSSGTVAYLNGLILEALGRTTDAQAAFAQAAAQAQARLWFEGPLVAPLAKAKIQNR